MPPEVIDESWIRESADAFGEFSKVRGGIFPTLYAWFGGAMHERRRLRKVLLAHLQSYDAMLAIEEQTHVDHDTAGLSYLSSIRKNRVELKKAIAQLRDSPMDLVFGRTA